MENQRIVDEDTLVDLLKEAESAHAGYEKQLGERDDAWPAWYAHYIIERLPMAPDAEMTAEPYIAG